MYVGREEGCSQTSQTVEERFCAKEKGQQHVKIFPSARSLHHQWMYGVLFEPRFRLSSICRGLYVYLYFGCAGSTLIDYLSLCAVPGSLTRTLLMLTYCLHSAYFGMC